VGTYSCDHCSADPIRATRYTKRGYTKRGCTNYDLCSRCFGELSPADQAAFGAVPETGHSGDGARGGRNNRPTTAIRRSANQFTPVKTDDDGMSI
jgi:hypothetical protein